MGRKEERKTELQYWEKISFVVSKVEDHHKAKDKITVMTLSETGEFLALGTLKGYVLVYDTIEN